MFRKKKPAEPEEIKNPPWVATFCDMVLLMISFFIILIAFSTFKVGRVVQFVSGFQGSFKVLPGGYKTDKGDQVIIPYQDIAKTYRDPGEILSGLKTVDEYIMAGKYNLREGMSVTIAGKDSKPGGKPGTPGSGAGPGAGGRE